MGDKKAIINKQFQSSRKICLPNMKARMTASHTLRTGPPTKESILYQYEDSGIAPSRDKE